MASSTILQQVKNSLPEGHLPKNYGVYFKNTLVALCHALEDHILQAGDNDPRLRPLVLVTFQQGKWYLQEANRYREIAACSRQVAIAAVADSGFVTHPTGSLENVALIELDEQDTLASEWNLIILAPNYAATLLCHELSPEEYHFNSKVQRDVERKFYGLWTFEKPLVEKSVEVFIQQIRDYNASLADDLESQRAQILSSPAVTPADLTGVVSRIIGYLQTSQQQLVTVTRQTRELAELEGQALRLNRNLAANKLQAFLRMAQRVDEKDSHNPVASLQVAALAETLGQILDLPSLQLRRLRLAALLYRIGLAQAPSEIFSQPVEIDSEATNSLWRERGILGAQLLATMPELHSIERIVRHHLEYWDGSGQPHGLKAEEIPIESRILGLVAHFQEQTQSRGDRPAMSLGEALAACQDKRGSRFDPGLVESLNTVVRLAEMGLMQLPERPSQLPAVWLEDVEKEDST